MKVRNYGRHNVYSTNIAHTLYAMKSCISIIYTTIWRDSLNKYVSCLLYYFHPINQMQRYEIGNTLISLPEYDFNSVLVMILLSYVHHFIDSLTW